MTGGKIEGSVRDKGMFGGGVRSFLLSDRWFSYDHKLDADIELVSITGLAESVKQLLVSQCDMIQIPKQSEPARKIGFWQRIRPSKPKRPPAEPEMPVLALPEEPTAPPSEHWHIYFKKALKSNFKGAVIFVIVVSLLGGWMQSFDVAWVGASMALVYLLLCMPIDFVNSLDANKRAYAKYKEELEAYPELVEAARNQHNERIQVARNAHSLAQQDYKEDYIKYRADVAKASQQTAFEVAENARFNKEMKEYGEGMKRIELHRETLWERSCVCSRCSTTYLPAG